MTDETTAASDEYIQQGCVKRRKSKPIVRTYKDVKRQVHQFMLDGRSAISKQLAVVRNEIARDLGGADQLSAAQLILVDTAAKSYLLLEAVDGWLFTSGTLINKRSKTIHRGALDRMRLADSLTRQLATLGLERKQRRLTP